MPSLLQVNKNWLLKARVGNDAAAAAVVFKAWWQPSATFGLAANFDFAKRAPRLGFTFNLENYGNIRYAALKALDLNLQCFMSFQIIYLCFYTLLYARKQCKFGYPFYASYIPFIRLKTLEGKTKLRPIPSTVCISKPSMEVLMNLQPFVVFKIVEGKCMGR